MYIYTKSPPVLREGFKGFKNIDDSLSLFLSSEYAKQIEEEIDKVEIESQGTKESQLLRHLSTIGCLKAHLLNLLCVVGCKTYKDKDTYIADDKVET